ncbi:MAG: FAD-dependent oxidoreductase [Pseudohongiella sp.]|nr:FAD-dependent oxidoreductase [Pseudohongiella sp.]MDO9521589.1 FAD-dependent oxidoreductase [Pseudohongiella sp.]
MNSPELNNKEQTAIVIGASHAGSQLAIHLRKSGWLGRIVLIGDEAHLPYHRPPLSKAVMSGSKNAEDIQLRPSALYDNNQIELKLGSHVDALLREDQRVLLSTGESLHYDRLALCTGASPIRLPLGDGLDGVFYLRSLDDVLAIRSALPDVKQAVIVGAGYIGLEAAAVLRSQGIDVTVLERADRVLKRVTGEEVSGYFASLHQLHGVDIRCNAEVTAINGQGNVDSVSCADGSKFEAQLVIIGVGVVPETRLAQEAGLRIENGIHVDEYARTSDEKIFAAGDCASHPSFLYQRRLRLESVQNANDQSRVAAVNMIALQEKYCAAPWFWSDQYDIKLQSAGLSQDFDQTELEGSLNAAESQGFVLKYFRQGQLIAADCVNRPKDFMAIKTALAQRL